MCVLCVECTHLANIVSNVILAIQNGIGNIASFIDYIAGRRQGVYFPEQFLIT